MILQFLSEGFLLGLSTGPTCFATCGPVYTPYLMQRQLNWMQSLVYILKISGGRFLAYLLFGFVAGFLGKEINEINRSWFTAAAYILFSGMLILSAFRTRRKEQGCQVARWARFSDSPFLLGIVTGVNFCPSFLIALTNAVDLSGPVSGMLLFVAFFVGTNLFIFPLVIFGVMGNKKLFRTIGIIASLAVATWFTTKAVKTIIELMRPVDTTNVVSILDATNLYIVTPDSAAFGPMRDTLVNHRKGLTVFMANPDTINDSSCYMLIDPEWLAKSGRNFESLKKPGRFAILLPEAPKDSVNKEYIEQIMNFFNDFNFKLDPHGSVFSMSKFK